MKRYLVLILCLLMWVPVAQAVEVTNKHLEDHYEKGITAFENKKWIDAIKHLFVYRELAALGNAPVAKLSEVDGYIKEAEENEKCGPVNVIRGRGGAEGGGTILRRRDEDR